MKWILVILSLTGTPIDPELMGWPREHDDKYICEQYVTIAAVTLGGMAGLITCKEKR